MPMKYVGLSLDDCNNAKEQTIYILTNAGNRPSGTTSHTLVTMGNDSMKLQFASDDAKVYRRMMYEGTWTVWIEM